MKPKRRKVKKTDFSPNQNDIDKAKEEYLRNGGSVTILPTNDDERFNPYVSVHESRTGTSLIG